MGLSSLLGSGAREREPGQGRLPRELRSEESGGVNWESWEGQLFSLGHFVMMAVV